MQQQHELHRLAVDAVEPRRRGVDGTLDERQRRVSLELRHLQVHVVH
jgi:hypothetical protein